MNKKILLIIIPIIVLLAVISIIVLNSFDKKKNIVENADIIEENSTSTNAANISKSQKEKVQDVYDHLMDEDWEYIWNKIEHYENEIITIEDLKYYFKSNISKSEVDEGKTKLSEQGYEIGAIEIQNDEEKGDVIAFTINNEYNTNEMWLYEKGTSKDKYKLVLDSNFSSNYYVGGDNAEYRGNAVIFFKDLENIKIRNTEVDDKFIDENFFAKVNNIEKTESNETIDYSKYKTYRLILPVRTLNKYDEETVKVAKEEYGIDVGNPGKLVVTADSKFGKVVAPDGLDLDSYGSENNLLAKYGYIAKFYLDSDEGRSKVLNGLKDNFNGILSLYEETGTYLSEDYRKFFVEDFSDEGYKSITETLEETLANKGGRWELKNFNRRVDGVVATDKGIEYLGNNLFSFYPGTATIWEQETGINGQTTTKTCQSISNTEIIVEVQEDGTTKIKKVSANLFKSLCLMMKDFEWEY